MEYQFLGEHEQAISHFGNSIRIEDTSVNRINRMLSYYALDECDNAIIDAKAALELEAKFTVGYHTDVEANYILATCNFWNDQYWLSLQYIDAAIALAKENQYEEERIVSTEEEREIILSFLE